MTTWGSGTLDAFGDVGRYSSIAGTSGTVHIAYYDVTNGDLKYATNPENALRWKYQTNGCIDSSPVVSLDGKIYAGSDDGRLYSINYDGTPIWSYLTGGSVHSSPAIASDGTI